MATNFPSSLDSLTNPTSSDNLSSPTHSDQHANANDAVEALEKLAVGPLVYNVKGEGAVGDGATDDTAAIQSAITAAESAGAGVIFFPEGEYLVTSELLVSGSNLSFVGDNAKFVDTSGFIFQNNSDNPFTSGNLTYYTMSGNYTRGDTVITLATVAEAGNFSASDFVWVRTRQTLSSGSDQPVAELNRVVSADDSTGEVVMEWPLAKDYTDDGVATHAVAVTTEVHENIRFKGLRFDATGQRALQMQNVLNCVVEDCVFEGSGAMAIRGRFIKVRNNRGHIVPDWAGGWRPYYLALDTGTCDVLHEGNTWSSTGLGILHIHEGVANVVSRGNTYQQAASDASAEAGWGVVSIRALSWNVTIVDTIVNAPVAHGVDAQASSVYAGEGNEGLFLDHLTVLGTAASSSVDIGSDSTGAVLGCDLLATPGTRALDVNSTGFVVEGNNLGGHGSSIATGAIVGRNRGGADMTDFLAAAHTWAAKQTFSGNNLAETDEANTWSAKQTVNADLAHSGTNLGFFGATPTGQGTSTVDIKDLLVALGLLVDAGATPLDLDSGALTANSASIADGTVSSPALRWTADPDTGFYRIGADSIGLSLGGILRMQWANYIFAMPSTSAVKIRFNGNTGLIEWGPGDGTLDTRIQRAGVGFLYTPHKFQIDGDIGFYGTSPVAQQSITGSTDTAKIDSIIAALAALGLATDDTT